jgi:hypothetical protein
MAYVLDREEAEFVPGTRDHLKVVDGVSVEVEPIENPYRLTEIQLSNLLRKITTERVPYISKETNPDIENFSIYVIEGTDPDSNAARALEGKVFSHDWGLPEDATRDDFAPFEDNSDFILLIDTVDSDNPVIAGVLRIADCMKGPSETIGFFHETFGDEASLPDEMTPDEQSQSLWDIVGVVADPEYRNGIGSAWLYHSLYRKSLEDGVTKWISNVTPKEMHNLKKYIGIPFEEIPGVETAHYTSPLDGKVTDFNFYSIQVSNIAEVVAAGINEKENNPKSDLDSLLAFVARIALLGTSKPQ